MKPKETLEGWIQQNKSALNTNPQTDQKILADSLSAMQSYGCTKPSKLILFRRPVMKTTIKFSAAAIVLIAAIFSLMLFNKTVSPAYALEQMRNAMNNATWMHAIVNMKGFCEPNSEFWYSPSLGIEASRSKNGLAIFTDIQKQESFVYDPNTNTLTLSAAEQNGFLKANTVSGLIDLLIKILNDNEDARMITTTESFQGQEVDVHVITIPKGEIGTEVWKLIVEKKSRLLKKMELEDWNEKGTFIKVANYTFDYLNTGPMNIYELNVPRTHKIVDKRPSVDIKTIIDRYETARQGDFTHYTALILFASQNDKGQPVAEEATILYINGNIQRREKLSLTDELIYAQHENKLNLISQMGDTLDSMLTWWETREHLSRRLATMYDGKYLHTIRRSLNTNEYQNRDDNITKSRESLYTPESYHTGWMGVGDFFRFDRDHPVLTRIENDYSKQHNLICLQNLDEVNGPESIKYKMPYGRLYKRLCYLDPEKDYICCRMETYLIQDEHWQREYKNAEKYLVKNTDQSLEFTEREVREIAEYSQTSSGKWYPTEIQWKNTTQLGNAKVGDDLHVIKIYLDTEREIPGNIFDKEAFSKYLSK
jgi:hypothetical protein